MSTARYARWDGVGRPFTVVETPLPDPPGPGRVLVEVDLATVCGSDLHTVTGRRPAPCPGVLGHEQVGRVVAIGSPLTSPTVSSPAGAGRPPLRVDGRPLAVGDRVVWSVTASCGDCPACRSGLEQKCARLRKYGHEPLTGDWNLSGGFATHCELLPGTGVVVVPGSVPDAVAAPASCATATVSAALAAAGPLDGARVLVTGAGMLGVTAAAMATEAGGHVLVTDPDPARRAMATRFGAAEVAAELPAGSGAMNVAVELSGHPGAVADCLGSLGVGGTAVLAGSVFPGPAVPVDPERIVRNLLTVVGVHNYRPGDLGTAVEFLAAHHDRYPFAELVSGRHRLDQLDAALDAARTGSAPRQAVLPAG